MAYVFFPSGVHQAGSLRGGLGVIIAIIVLVVLQFYESGTYPKLSEFGLKEWSVECKGSDRTYRLYSKVHSPSGTSRESISDRGLSFLDQNSDILYNTRMFDKSSLDTEGVWRFKYRKMDVRLFGKKDRSKVLQGDEKVFEIAEDFQSMVVITKDGQRLQLSCQPFQR